MLYGYHGLWRICILSVGTCRMDGRDVVGG